jgi:hypothetical protein
VSKDNNDPGAPERLILGMGVAPGVEFEGAAGDARHAPQSSFQQLCPDRVEVPSASAVIEPLSPARYKVQFTASAELHRKLERLTALMRSEHPVDLATVIEVAISEKLERLEARRYAGRRCTELARLEFHHRHPFGMGGDHSPGNVSLLCQAHNRLLAVSDYGAAAVERRRNPELPTPDLGPTRSRRSLAGRGRA